MRNTKIVNIRAIAIMLVVFGHSIILYSSAWNLYTSTNQVLILDYLKRIIDLIQMPLFFSISGFLFFYSINKKINFFKFIKNKCLRLLIPFICIGIFWMLPLRIMCKYKAYENVSLSKIIFNKILLGQDCGHLWFLPTLFLMFVEMYFIVKILKRLNSNILFDIIVFIFLVCLSKYSSSIPNIIPFFSRACENIIWFYLGFILNKYEKQIDNLQYIYLEFLALVVSLICWWNWGGYLFKLIFAIFFLLIIYKIIPNKVNKYIEVISDNSFGIYLFHSPLIYITFCYFTNSNPVIVVVLNFIVFGEISLVISLLIRKTRLKFIIGE